MTESTTGSDGNNAAANANRKKRKSLLIQLAVVVIIALIVSVLYWLLWARFYESTEDAYVQGNVVQISSRIAGTVTAIYAEDTDRIEAGDVLVQLDDTDTANRLAVAKAQLSHTLRGVRALYAEATQFQAQLTQAKKDFARAKRLRQVEGISTESYQHAKTAVASAESRFQAAQAHISGTTPTTHPKVKLAIAKLKKAWLAEQRTQILSPVSGYVAKRDVQLGEKIQPGQPLMAVIPLHHLWIDANFKETQLSQLRIGQPVEIETDIYGGDHTYHGTVKGLTAGTGSAFSLLPAQNATGNWIKIVQRLPVRISLNPEELAKHPLLIGLSTTVTVDIHDQDGQMLAASTASKDRMVTQAYQPDMPKFEALVKRIVERAGG